jgi:hypothetical protein
LFIFNHKGSLLVFFSIHFIVLSFNENYYLQNFLNMFYDMFMPRKTLVLISALVLVTVILFFVALKSSNNKAPVVQPSPQASMPKQVSPTVPAHSTLNISPNTINVAPGQKGSVDVNLDTSDNQVTAIQLEIAYDPNFITNVKVTPGSLFLKPVVLFEKNKVKEGRFTYMYGISPSAKTINGNGIAATITFTALNKIGDTQLALLPTSLVTARGISESVLKAANGALIKIGSSAQNVSTPVTNEAKSVKNQGTINQEVTVSGSPR